MERATLPSSLSAHPAAPADQIMADAAQPNHPPARATPDWVLARPEAKGVALKQGPSLWQTSGGAAIYFFEDCSRREL